MNATSEATSEATSDATSARSDTRAWMAFAACGAIWGSTFLVISIGNDTLAPVWAATLRLALAALLLGAWTRARGQALPRGAALRAALGYGVTQFGVNLPLLYWGEMRVPSGLSAVVYATIPLTSALMTRALGMERLTPSKILGAVVAFGGVAVLFSSTLSARVSSVGLGAIFVGATAASLGTVLLKRGPRQDPFGANAVGCAVGAPIAAALSFALGEAHGLPATLGATWPLVYLTVGGSLGAYVIMSWLVNRWSVTRTAYVTVIVPVLALALGAIVRHERLAPSSLGGAALVLAGLLLGMRPEARPA
ncbi:MAG TPA: EamA family transporter [Polyangia bacterium]|nr:EamA family transporter [Polyangia bacterium]